MFFLDTRSYRDANAAPDDPQQPKTLIGKEQRDWLLDGLERSDATWKVVVCGVPISVPTSNEQRGRDGWANGDGKQGFENELRSILVTLHERGVHDLVFRHHRRPLRHRLPLHARFPTIAASSSTNSSAVR